MKREELKELGLNEEQIDKVMDINGKDITKLQHDRDSFKSQVDELGKNLTERDGQISELSELAKGHKELEDKVAELTEANTKSKTEYETKIVSMQKNHLVNSYLTDKKAKNIKAVTALFDLEKVKVEGDKLVGMDEQFAEIHKGNEFLFDKGIPPAGGKEIKTPPSGGEAEIFANFSKL